MENKSDEKRVKIAFKLYEEIFERYKNSCAYRSNDHTVGDPLRVEYDFTEIEKGHLNLLKSNVDVEIALVNHEATKANQVLTKKLNHVTTILTVFTAIIAFGTLVQAWPTLKSLFC